MDERIIRVDWDIGFEEGRQYGRGKSGFQVRDEVRQDEDPGRELKNRPTFQKGNDRRDRKNYHHSGRNDHYSGRNDNYSGRNDHYSGRNDYQDKHRYNKYDRNESYSVRYLIETILTYGIEEPT